MENLTRKAVGSTREAPCICLKFARPVTSCCNDTSSIGNVQLCKLYRLFTDERGKLIKHVCCALLILMMLTELHNFPSSLSILPLDTFEH